MVIYRYENKKGKGPYRNSMQIKWSGNKYVHEDANHPSSYEDFPAFSSDQFIACKSIKSLKQWFKGYNPNLKKTGFKIVKYKVKNYQESLSGLQVSFLKTDVIKKRKLKA